MALLMKVKTKLTIGLLTLLGNFILDFITKFIIHYLFNIVRNYYERQQQVLPLVQKPEQASDAEHDRTRMVIGTGAVGANKMDNSTSPRAFDYKIQGLAPPGITIHSPTLNTDDSDDADDSAKDGTDSELEANCNNKHGPESSSSEPPEERYEVAATEQAAIPDHEPKIKSKKKKAKRSKQKANKSSTPSQMKRGKASSTAKQLGSPNYTITLDDGTMQQQHHPVKRPYYKQSTATVDQDS